MGMTQSVPCPHLIEFISGTGVVIDGNVYTTGGPLNISSGGTAGPWVCTMPGTLVGPVVVSIVGGGAGGGAGGNDATNASGGGGGAGGAALLPSPVVFRPGDGFTVTLGAGGSGGVKG